MTRRVCIQMPGCRDSGACKAHLFLRHFNGMPEFSIFDWPCFGGAQDDEDFDLERL